MQRVWDDKSVTIDERYNKRVESSGWQSYKCKAVHLIETGEVYPSATVVACETAVPPSYITRAASAHGAHVASARFVQRKSGIHIFVPAPWEYINSNKEEKDEKHD